MRGGEDECDEWREEREASEREDERDEEADVEKTADGSLRRCRCRRRRWCRCRCWLRAPPCCSTVAAAVLRLLPRLDAFLQFSSTTADDAR